MEMTAREIIIIQDMLLSAIFDHERLKAKTKDRICEVKKMSKAYFQEGEIRDTLKPLFERKEIK